LVERDYKELNLNRDVIEGVVKTFAETNSFVVRNITDKPGTPGLRVTIGKPGIDDATIDIFFLQTGCSTIHFKTGKNQELGRAVADALYDTIHPDEFESVNLVLKGISIDDIKLLIAELTEEQDSDIFISDLATKDKTTRWKLQSRIHQDEVTITHHGSTNRLQIQGRPLSCYRQLTYLITSILDLTALECVLFKKDDNRSEVIRPEVAEEFLGVKLGGCVNRIPGATKKLLVSALCVRLASPQLPDYCMLLYPELRSLEGAIRQKLAEKGLEKQEDTFGKFFERSGGQFVLRGKYHDLVDDARMISVLGDAYGFFNKHRHTLFHMEALVDGSRLITDFNQLLALADTAYVHLAELYS
jgi:hypothetical protein